LAKAFVSRKFADKQRRRR